MKISLVSFTTRLDAALIEKGKKWYSLGMVQHVKNEKGCIWNADLIGPNKQFKVSVEIIGKDVNTIFCTCGPKLCSHVVALLFELVEKDYPTEKYYGDKRPILLKVSDSSIPKLLRNIGDDELKEFIEAYAEGNEDFRKRFIDQFGVIDLEDQVQRFRSIIKKTLTYDYIKDAMEGTNAVLLDAAANYKDGNYAVSFAACKAVVLEMSPLLGSNFRRFADNAVSKAIDRMRDLALCKNLDGEVKSDLFNLMFEEYKKPAYADFRSLNAWTDIFNFTAPTPEKLQDVVIFIDKQLEKVTFDSYRKELLDHKKKILAFIEKANTPG